MILDFIANLDIEKFTSIYIETIKILSVLCIGMIVYRFSIIYKLKKSRDVEQAAYTDQLTKKGNRYKFNSVMDKLIENENSKFALCFMDLDGFKHINDNMGHDAGDELLIKLSDLLARNVPSNGEVFRLGGDEFAIVIKNISGREEVEKTLKKIEESVKTPLEISGSMITLEYSLGVSMFPEDSKSRVELVNYADTAMYHVKETGKNSYYFHNESLKSRAENKSKMEKDMKDAFEKGAFDIDFQPRLSINKPEEVWLEALLYWNHETLGKLRAEYFVSYAEAVGLIISIDELVLIKSIQKLKDLKEKGYVNVKIALNMSLRHFIRKDFLNQLCDILDRNKIEHGTIMFEITDNIDLSKIEDYKTMLDKIKTYGVKISINNLEIKYEVMSLFKRLPVDEVKISADYIEGSAFNKNVLKDIVELGRDLYYQVTVVRIESENTMERIVSYGVDRLQGNHLFKPVDNDKITEFLEMYKEYSKEIEQRLGIKI